MPHLGAGIPPEPGTITRGPAVAVSQAALRGAQHSRALHSPGEQGGGCEETSPPPLKPPIDMYPWGGGAEGWPEGTHGSRERPWGRT